MEILRNIRLLFGPGDIEQMFNQAYATNIINVILLNMWPNLFNETLVHSFDQQCELFSYYYFSFNIFLVLHEVLFLIYANTIILISYSF